ncbi:hypothetical protein K6119_10345 [Paracrocinitomix mangrovi]|uniref:hypothetical protein n=1 Tax=Paracrocinitomix mangrovi TaxID=2862509 RepID=UPI001C8ED3C0|nr:hypothetical protein [Paracrocinitomix mangrovi]UKN00133.1 hypothetical protein K6119_10345 [Paracrocinitomix mangrovi]
MELNKTEANILKNIGLSIENGCVEITDILKKRKHQLALSEIGKIRIKINCWFGQRLIQKFKPTCKRSKARIYKMTIISWDTEKLKVLIKVSNPKMYKEVLNKLNIYFYHAS